MLPEAEGALNDLVKLSVVPLVLVIVFDLLRALLATAGGLMLLALICAGAYALFRPSRPPRAAQGTPRGAERTPLLPPDEDAV
jgi:hypothetical protein